MLTCERVRAGRSASEDASLLGFSNNVAHLRAVDGVLVPVSALAFSQVWQYNEHERSPAMVRHPGQ